MAVTYTPALRRPFKCPMEHIYRTLDDADYCQLRFSKSLGMKRLGMPAVVTDLLDYNQTFALLQGSPWKASADSSFNAFKVGATSINSGTTAYFHRLDYAVANSTGITPIESGATAFNWTHTPASNLYSYEFYLDNDLEETAPLVLADDTQTAFWDSYNPGGGAFSCTEADDAVTKVKGVDSLKMTIGAGASSEVGVSHDFAGADWSAYEFLCFYLYGTNTGEQWKMWVYNVASTTRLAYYVTNNFAGWKRFVVPLKSFAQEVGVGVWSDVGVMYFFTAAPVATAIYLDRMVLDVGQWVKVEVYVPDSIASEGIALYSWNGAAYLKAVNWDDDSHTWGVVYWYAMNGMISSDIYAGATGAPACYPTGLRGETKSILAGFPDPGDITYSAYYGCKSRVGFALKLPPDDGLDSSTAGISQVKLKLEVYYGTGVNANGTTVAGMATYEFADSANTYYGLQNMNDSWLALFPSAGSGKVEWLYFDSRPIYLAVRADENENIDMISFRLPAGGRAYAGSIPYGLVTRDTDADGVPDFLEE